MVLYSSFLAPYYMKWLRNIQIIRIIRIIFRYSNIRIMIFKLWILFIIRFGHFFTNEYYSIIRFASKRLFVATLDISHFNLVIIWLFWLMQVYPLFICLHFETQHNAMVVSCAAAVLVVIRLAWKHRPHFQFCGLNNSEDILLISFLKSII